MAKWLVCVVFMWGLTLIGWAIFRSQNLAELGQWFAAFGRWNTATSVAWAKPFFWLVLHATPLLVLQWLTRRKRDEAEVGPLPWAARGFVYTVLFVATATSLVGDKEFIYFQF